MMVEMNSQGLSSPLGVARPRDMYISIPVWLLFRRLLERLIFMLLILRFIEEIKCGCSSAGSSYSFHGRESCKNQVILFRRVNKR